jgi:hypothetical protein
VGSKVQGFFTPRRTIGGGLALGGVGSNVYGALAQPTTGMQQPNVQAQPTIGGQQQGIGQRNIDPRIQNIINLRAQYEKPTAR